MAVDNEAEHCQRLPGVGLTRRILTAGMVGAIAAISCPAIASPVTVSPRRDPVRFGLTPVFLSNDLEVLDELEAYLADVMRRDVQLITQRTYQEVTALLVSGSLDAAWICGFPYMKFRQDLELIATPVWRGKPLYQSYLIVGANDPATTFDDCEGDVHAFSDPDSNSGYLVTKTYLAERNTSEDRFFRKFLFTYGHRNVIRAVAAGLAGSGSVDGYVWEVMREQEPDLVSQTKVIVRSHWHGFPPIAAPAGLARTPAFQGLQSAFLGMGTNATGRSVLNRLKLDGFSRVAGESFESIAANMDTVRRLG
ncbi:MAG: PhnD/SsuA/transferrin family substrate-binding protein [Pseudorhizobium sp.]